MIPIHWGNEKKLTASWMEEIEIQSDHKLHLQHDDPQLIGNSKLQASP